MITLSMAMITLSMNMPFGEVPLWLQGIVLVDV